MLKKNKFFILIGCLLLLLSSCNQKEKNTNIATWLWHTDLITADLDRTIQFIEEMQVQMIYLQYNSKIENSAYKNFIAAMKKIGVSVYALDGGADWGIIDRKKEEQFLNWFIDYQTSAKKEERFRGIHLDIEPYLLNEWKTKQGELVHEYQQLVMRMKEVTKTMDISLGLDIPFWFDKVLLENKKDSLSRWTIQHVDEITIMAYRNFAKGSNGIIDISEKEIEWAEQEGKDIYIAIETKKLLEEHTSFYGKGKQALFEEIEIVMNHYKKRISGIAIHHFKSWQNLMNETE